ncbi:hypothetical protein BDV12DRAFT_170767 [Aspergillus spectabilis]
MDPRQPQSQSRQPSSSKNLLHPPPHHQRPSASSSTTAQPSASRPPSAPVTAQPGVTIAESVVFYGTYPVTLERGTVIHPRTRIYAFEGPVKFGEGCIISEKCSIGTPPGSKQKTGSSGCDGDVDGKGLPILISPNVTIGPQVTIHPGVYIHSAAVIETMAVLHRKVDIGTHSKICARCEIAEGARIKEWTVVWGAGKGIGMQRRVRTKGKVVNPLVIGNAGDGSREGRIVEDARLVAVKRERETLARYILQARRK